MRSLQAQGSSSPQLASLYTTAQQVLELHRMGSEGWLHMLLRDPLPLLVWQMPMPILDGANGVAY